MIGTPRPGRAGQNTVLAHERGDVTEIRFCMRWTIRQSLDAEARAVSDEAGQRPVSVVKRVMKRSLHASLNMFMNAAADRLSDRRRCRSSLAAPSIRSGVNSSHPTVQALPGPERHQRLVGSRIHQVERSAGFGRSAAGVGS